MPAPNLQELKKILVQAGFEVYRARGAEIQLAERPRDNLIMDAGITICLGEPLRIRLAFRAPKADFPGESDETLFHRASKLAATPIARGFTEAERRTRHLPDPSDPSRILDTWYEVFFERAFSGVDELLAELPVLLQLDKTASR
ncbi:MAG: hypothetical protein RMJ98_01560 [Myxococcales bacterium]|nr:hypothetical protein [Polyangiaceae bacterium]MDW8247974.1 hypothetical protein [Myxococcales bacterium]